MLSVAVGSFVVMGFSAATFSRFGRRDGLRPTIVRRPGPDPARALRRWPSGLAPVCLGAAYGAAGCATPSPAWCATEVRVAGLGQPGACRSACLARSGSAITLGDRAVQQPGPSVTSHVVDGNNVPSRDLVRSAWPRSMRCPVRERRRTGARATLTAMGGRSWAGTARFAALSPPTAVAPALRCLVTAVRGRFTSSWLGRVVAATLWRFCCRVSRPRRALTFRAPVSAVP